MQEMADDLTNMGEAELRAAALAGNWRALEEIEARAEKSGNDKARYAFLMQERMISSRSGISGRLRSNRSRTCNS